MPSISNQVAYLTGGERPTAACMNALHQALDRKLSQLLSGKSPVIAQSANYPAYLLGKSFFFTNGQGTVYSSQVPGSIFISGGVESVSGTYPPGYQIWVPPVVRDYKHDQFTSAVAAINTSSVTWDEVNKIANVPRFPQSAYKYLTDYPTDPGLPWVDPYSGAAAVQVGFLENSMQCHYLMHQGASDTSPVPYYIQEASAKMPEKRYAWAVAELVLEGATNVTLPDTYDKYNFFRVHNLNPVAATVSWGTHFTITVPPFGCQTVRRSSVTTGYATNGNYFWYAIGGKDKTKGDPRFFWFQPCGYGLPGQTANRFTWSWDGRVADTMTQNNLTNPVILLDWIEYFTRDVDDFPGQNNYGNAPSTIHAGFIRDLAVWQSEYAHYTSLYGDPSNTATCLGDLIHHKGTVYAVQASKTQNDAVSGKPFVKVIKGAFNGYATFVADMAALGVAASVNASGDYQLQNVNPAQYDVTLVPVGTNFLKQGEHVPDHVVLSGATVFTIENAVLEIDPMNSESTLSATANQQVFPPTFTNAANTRQWVNDYTMSGPATVTGPNIPTLNTSNRTATPTALHGIHAVTIANLLPLNFWGDPAVNPQSGLNFAITNARLQITPQGLVLTWSEQYSGGTPAPNTQPYPNYCLGYLTMVFNKRVMFRHHGFGYVSDSYGSQSTGYLSARQPIYMDGGNNFQSDLYNTKNPGADFTFGKTDCTQSGVKVQQRVSKQQGTVFNWGGGRFWQCKQPGNYLQPYLTAVQGITWNAVSKTINGDGSMTVVTDSAGTITLPPGWTDTRTNSNWNNGISVTAAISSFPVICFPLLPEMYNLIAQHINQITTGIPINYQALKFIYSGNVFAFDPQFTANLASPGGAGWIGGDNFSYFSGPIPMDCWATFDAGSVFDNFCAAQGITVQTAANLPTVVGGQNFAGNRTTPAVMVDTVNVTVSNCDFQWGADSTTSTSPGPGGTTITSVDGPNASWTADLNVQGNTELLSSRMLRQGMPTGECCVGTFDPNNLPASPPPGFPPGTSPLASLFPANPLDWNYLVASTDMTVATATALGLSAPSIFKGDIMPWNGGNGGLISVFGGSNPGDATDPTGAVWNLTTSYQNMHWIKLEDAEAFLLQFGFTFNFEEVVIPLALAYLEDAFTLSNQNCCKTLTATESQHTSGPADQVAGFNAYVNSLTSQNGQIVTVGGADGAGCYQPYGTWLGWFVDTRPDPVLAGQLNAKWKLRENSVTFYAPLPVTNLSCRINQSPLLRVSQYNAGMGMDVEYGGSAYYNPPAGAPYWLGFTFPPGGDPGDTDPNIGSGLGWGGCANINAGQEPTAGSVAFIVSQFVPSGTDTFTPFAAMGRQPMSGFQSYEENSILDHFDAYLVHSYGYPRTFNISLVGVSSWIRTVDGWASADAAFAIDGDGSTIVSSCLYQGGCGYGIGYTALNAPANITVPANSCTNTPNGGSETLTILQGGAQTRYQACFNLARLAIDLTNGTTPTSYPMLASSSQPASSSQQL